MEARYKGHGILASARQVSDSDRFQPHVTVVWSEGQKEKAESAVFPLGSPTERQAELHGVQLAKKWIDDGKPEFHGIPLLRYVASRDLDNRD